MALMTSGSKSQGNQQAETGTVITLRVAGKNIGRATALTNQVDYGTQAVSGIGDYVPEEYVFLRFQGQLTLEQIMFRKQSMVDAGITDIGSKRLGHEGMGNTTIVVSDKYSKEVLAHYADCTPSTYNTTIRANQIVTEQAVFFYTSAQKKS